MYILYVILILLLTFLLMNNSHLIFNYCKKVYNLLYPEVKIEIEKKPEPENKYEFDDDLWSQNNIKELINHELTILSSTKAAFIKNGKLQLYEFNGSSWDKRYV